jgi:tRNA pseudouridine38-40 synthase
MLVLEYDGAGFCGWQRQKDARTVQGELEGVLSAVLQEKVSVTGAGRTDSGCHATHQVASFSTWSNMPLEKMARAVNGLMREEVVVRDIRIVPDDFHARYSAVARTYNYSLATRPTALFRCRAWTVRKPVDIEVMNDACSALVGEMDFSGFCKRDERTERNPICRVAVARWTPNDLGAEFEIVADRFMRGMIRMIVGTSVRIGTGRIPSGYVKQVLEGVDGCRGGPVAPARGLCLVDVEYGDRALLDSRE